jgi:predicted membrane channel-forming protein YqfA (hemolysin III family)
VASAFALKHPAARWAPLALVALVAVAMAIHGPIAQLDHYHEFADTRAFLGVPNAGDVLSNAGFLLVGGWALWALRDPARRRALGSAGLGFTVFFAALMLTALGSSWYHLAPDNARLVWDRLPIALACAGLIAGYYADTHGARNALALNVVLAIAAAASVAWWSITDRSGVGDLRPYLFLQVAPLLLVPAWQALAQSPRSERIAFGLVIALYAAAKAAELGDRTIFEALGFMSGHTAKHLLATAASLVLAASIVRKSAARA